MLPIQRLLLAGTRVVASEQDCERALAWIPQVEFEELWEGIRRMKAIYIFYRFLERTRERADEATGAILEDWMERIAAKGRGHQGVREKKQRIESELKHLDLAAQQAGVPVLLVKGCSIPWLLTDYEVREQNDIDIAVPDLSAMWRLIDVLIKQGYEVASEENPWVQKFIWRGEPVYCGHITLMGPGQVYVDIHTHSMSFGQAEMLDIPLWEQCIKLEQTAGGELYVPRVEDAFLFLIAHSYNHGYFTMKDLNDVYLMFTQYEGRFDWSYVWEQAVNNSLQKGIVDALFLLQAHFGYDAQHLFAAQGWPLDQQGFAIHGLEPIDDWIMYHHMLDIAQRKQDLEYGLEMLGKAYRWQQDVQILMDDEREAEHDQIWERLERAHLTVAELGDQVLLYPISLFTEPDERPFAVFPDADWWREQHPQAVLVAKETVLLPVGDQYELLVTPCGSWTTTKTMIFTEEQIERLEETARGVRV